MTPLPPMLWIGGAPGAGKSTIARTIAHATDLPLHPIDRWTYDHAARRPLPLEALLARDAVLATRIRQEATGRTVIVVPPAPDWPTITRAVLAALGTPPGLAAGEPLSRQRRYENRAASRQLHLWSADLALPVPPTFPFACECGRSACQATRTTTAPEYDAHPTPFTTHSA